MDNQHTDEQGSSATTSADGNTHTVSPDIDSQSSDTSLETVKTVGLPSDVVMEPDPREKISPLTFSGTDAHPAVSDATSPLTQCNVSTSVSGDTFTSQVLSKAAPSLAPLETIPSQSCDLTPPFVTSDTAPPLVHGNTTAQMVSSSAHSDSASPLVHGDTTIQTESSSPQSDLAPPLVHGDTTAQTESSGAYSDTAPPHVHGDTTAPTESGCSLSTAPVESYLVKSPQGTKYSMTQSHVIEMDGQDVHVLVKHELSEEDTREVESWMESGGAESEEGAEELFRLCADQAKALEEWTEGESVQGIGERGEVKGEGGSVTMREATSATAEVPALSCNASRWSHADSLKLIHLYKENRHFFTNNQIKKKTVWTMLAGKLARSSKSKTKFTSSQVYNRWKNLTKTYRDCLQNIQHDGIWAGKCHFFEDMASVYNPGSPEKPRSSTSSHRMGRKRKRLGLAPPAREGSFRAIAPKVPLAARDEPKTCICGAGAESSSRVVEVGGGLEGVVRAVQDLHEEEKARDEWKMARLERMHREKMNLFAQFLDILKGQVA